jgi:hypothetical protein
LELDMRFVVVISALFVCACEGFVGAPIVLTADDPAAAPADGLSSVVLRAKVHTPDASTVSFTATSGMLAATVAPVVAGEAVVELWAPMEEELELKGIVTSEVTATVIVEGAPIASTTTVDFTFPTEGPARIEALTTPDRVLAGGAEPMTLKIDGVRLSAAELTITAETLSINETIAVDASAGPIFHHELTINAPATPGRVPVTIRAGNVTKTIDLVFIGEGDPKFDLTGTFAQVSYSHVTAKAFFLEGDQQTVVAPTFSLVNVTQDGAHLKMESETCEIQMPPVKVKLVSDCLIPSVGAGFLDATNRRAPPPLEFDLTQFDLGAQFDLGPDAFPIPLVLGANLTNPATDPLPDSDSDSSEFDDDGDGEPGVTIRAGDNVQHVAMRTNVTRMTATIVDSHTVNGSVESDSETQAIDAFIDIEPEITAHPSPFYMRRVDGQNVPTDISGRDGADGISCADVIAFKDELLAIAPPPAVEDICQ